MFKDITDLCAIVLVAGCLALIFCGKDGEVKGILALAAGWLFGKGYGTIKGKGGDNGKPI